MKRAEDDDNVFLHFPILTKNGKTPGKDCSFVICNATGFPISIKVKTREANRWDYAQIAPATLRGVKYIHKLVITEIQVPVPEPEPEPEENDAEDDGEEDEDGPEDEMQLQALTAAEAIRDFLQGRGATAQLALLNQLVDQMNLM